MVRDQHRLDALDRGAPQERGVGALVLGVPLAGTIGLVTFITAYVPYLGAFVAGVFTFAIALGLILGFMVVESRSA